MVVVVTLRKWGHFEGALCAAQCASGWLVGPVQEISASLRNNKGLVVPGFLGKARKDSSFLHWRFVCLLVNRWERGWVEAIIPIAKMVNMVIIIAVD